MTHVNPENQSESTTPAAGTGSGLPLRGLAMVLIAVAVVLVLWGLYATTQDSSDGEQTAAPTTEVAATSQSREPQRPTPTAENTREDTPEVTPTGDGTPVEEPPAPAPAPAGEPGRLNVINNSTVPNLAADVADRLRGDGFEVGEVGNMADHILPETTVFFQPGNAAAEQRARELADRVGGVARAYEGFLPANTAGRDDLTLVLVDQVAL